MLNWTEHNIHHWGTPPVTGLQVDFFLLITTILAQLFNPHLCLLIQPIHQQFVSENLMGHSVKSLTEVQADNIHCSGFYQASHFTIDVYQVDQACVPLGEGIWSAAVDFFVLNIFFPVIQYLSCFCYLWGTVQDR